MTIDKIQAYIDEEINPALEAHGGHLLIEKFDEKHQHLYVKMGGGCHGCASASITLKLQVERFLMEEFPELKEIEDVTDHSVGDNPYYS